MLMQLAESAQTLHVRVLRPVLKVAIHNEYGSPMCAVVGFKPGLKLNPKLISNAALNRGLKHEITTPSFVLFLPITKSAHRITQEGGDVES